MSIYPADSIKKILAKLDPIEVLKRIGYRAETVQDQGKQIRAFCPIHKETVFRTLIITRDNNQFRCSYSLCPGSKGGDLIQLYALGRGLSYDEATPELAQLFGLEVSLPDMREFVDSTLAVAKNYLELDSAEDAQKAFAQVLKADPDSLPALEGLVAALSKAGKEEEASVQRAFLIDKAIQAGALETARKALEERVDESPDDVEARQQLIDVLKLLDDNDSLTGQYMALAELHEGAGRIQEALAMLRGIEALGAGVVDVFPHKIDLLQRAGRTVEAAEEWMKRAAEMESQGRHDAVMESLAGALSLAPERDDLRSRAIERAVVVDPPFLDQALGWVDGFMERNDWSQAVVALERAHGRAPRDERIFTRLVESLRKLGRSGEADALLFQKIDAMAAEGDVSGAMREVETGLALAPDSTPLLRRKAFILARSGRIEAAKPAYALLAGELEQEKNWPEAAEALREAVSLFPSDLAFRQARVRALDAMGDAASAKTEALALAELALEEGHAEPAIAAFDKALEYAPADPAIHLRRARAAERVGRLEEAAGSLLKAAESFMGVNAHEEALGALEDILRHDPDSVDALDWMATCQQKLGDGLRAAKTLERLATMLDKKGDLRRCEASLRRCLEIEPANLAASEALADILGRMGRSEEEVALLLATARSAVEQKRHPQAEKICQRILERRPSHVAALELSIQVNEAARRAHKAQELFLRLAEIHRQTGDRAQERKTYEAILERWPDNREIASRLIFLLWQQQDRRRLEEDLRRLVASCLRVRQFDEAMGALEKMRRLGPDEPLFLELTLNVAGEAGRLDDWESAARALAELARNRGQLDEAAAWMRRLIERKPGDETLRAELIGLLVRAEEHDEAAGEYVALGRLHLEREAPADAQASFEAALDLNPAHTEALDALTRLAIQQKRREDALALIPRLAGLYEHNEAPDDAVRTLRQAFEVDREAIGVREKIIEILRAKGADEEAAAELDTLRAIHEKKEDWNAALASAREKSGLFPDDPAARRDTISILKRLTRQEERLEEECRLAECLVRAGKPKEAIKILDDLAEEKPDSLRVRRLRAETFARAGNDKKALEEFLKISSLLPSVAAPSAGAPSAQEAIEPKLAIVHDYVFERFVVGPPNNFAYATAMAVAKAPAATYNPLFLYSDVGLGKTHLLHAIANHILAANPPMKILYTSADEFIGELVDAIESNTVKQFRARHKSADVLMLDDAQFLAGRERAQEEFFHIFNTLFQAGRQIVVTSDRPPKEMARLEKRLVSRFGAGVVVDIQAPDLETRIAILQREMKRISDVELPETLASILAVRLENNVRELKGALNQILAQARLRETPLTEAEAIEMVELALQKV